MNWIGQHIYDLVSRFRNDVYLEDISTGTIASGAHLGLDSNNKIVKAVDGGGDLTSIVAGTGLSGTSLTGPIPTLNVDASQPTITTLAGLTTIGATGINTVINSNDVQFYNAVDNGSPQLSIGASDSERFIMQTIYVTGAQTLNYVLFNTIESSSAAQRGQYLFQVDSTSILTIRDPGIDLYSNMGISISGTDIITDSSGTATLSNIDALDATTSATIEEALTVFGALTSFGAAGVTTNIAAGDVTMYNAVNDGNPTISLGSAAANRFEMVSTYNSGAQTLDSVSFNSYTTSGSANDGRYLWRVDEVLLMALLDAGATVYGNFTTVADGAAITSQNSTASSATEGGKLTLRCDDGAAMGDDHRLGVVEFSGAEDASNNRQTGARIQAMCDAAWSASENGTRLEFYTMDGNAASELSLTLDSDLLATFAGNIALSGDTITAGADLNIVATGNDIAVDTDNFVITSSTGNKPFLELKSTSNNNKGSVLQFTKDKGGAGADNDVIGIIRFAGDDAAQAQTSFAQITAQISEADDTDEAGKLTLSVAESNGTNTQLTAGLVLEGEHATDGEVDVTIAAGAASTTTIAGTLTMGSTATIDNSGVVQVAAQTVIDHDQLANFAAGEHYTQANITTVGTIGTGVWNATAIASAKMATGTASAQGALELATTGEADTGTDTARAVTPAGLKSHVDTRYAYSYMTWSASGTSSMNGSDPEWVFPNTVKGIYEEDWTKDENIIATSVGDTPFTTSRQTAVNALVIPHTGICVGFHAHGRNNTSNASFKTGLFHFDGSTTGTTNNGGIDYGATGNTHECTLRWVATADEAEASGGADSTSGESFKGPCKLVSNVTNTFAVTAGDALLPAIMGPDGSDEIFVTMSIILKIPLA